LNHVKGSGEAFYDGYFRKEGAKEAWLSYIDDQNGRVGKAIQA
jgi:hypothetical protein